MITIQKPLTAKTAGEFFRAMPWAEPVWTTRLKDAALLLQHGTRAAGPNMLSYTESSHPRTHRRGWLLMRTT